MYLNTLIIEETQSSPRIVCDADDGSVSITGNSNPDNAIEFYEPMMKWLESFFSSCTTSAIVINLDISSFNSSSMKLFIQLFDMFETNSKSKNIEIHWLYDKENQDMHEAGENLLNDYENLQIYLVTK
jgi:hypothetical protein